VAPSLQHPRPRGYQRTGPPLCPEIEASLGETVRAAQRSAAAPPVAGADPPPRCAVWSAGCASGSAGPAAARRSAPPCIAWDCRGRRSCSADPQRRHVEQIQDLLAGAQRDRHLLVYLDEAHIHQDADLGSGWSERGRRLWVASPSPRLSDKLSFYGLYLYNEGQVRLWPYARANGEHTIDVLRRLRTEWPS
jgi:hypothetical protein